MTQQIRHLHLVGATGALRTAVYDNRDHIVVPVVAMVEGVVWASNSDVPEFVSAEELAETPFQWNGRGCFAGHPKDGKTPIMANTPRTLEKSFGTIFDTATAERILRTRALEFDVYVDAVKAKAIGKAEERVVERLLAGERIEVSVGAFVEADEKDGTFNGIEYHGAWHSIVSDHIAFLSEEETGACSNEAGCGAPRQAIRHLISTKGIQRVGAMDKNKLLKERCAATLAAAEGMSDREVRHALDAALRAIEPGYMGVECVYPDDGYVLYYVAPEDKWKMMQRDYSLNKDGKATLKGKAVEVEAVTTYEPVTAQAKKPAAIKPTVLKAAGCGCKGDTMTRAERIAALVIDKHSGFKDGDEPFLETASDARLEEFSTAADVNRAAAGQIAKLETDNRNLSARLKVTDDRLRAAESTLTEDEFLARAPESFKTILNERKAAEDGMKASLVSQLKDLGANTEEELKTKSIGELQTLAAYARIDVPDFSGRAVPRLNAKQKSDYAPPDPYAAALKAMQQSKAH